MSNDKPRCGFRLWVRGPAGLRRGRGRALLGGPIVKQIEEGADIRQDLAAIVIGKCLGIVVLPRDGRFSQQRIGFAVVLLFTQQKANQGYADLGWLVSPVYTGMLARSLWLVFCSRSLVGPPFRGHARFLNFEMSLRVDFAFETFSWFPA